TFSIVSPITGTSSVQVESQLLQGGLSIPELIQFSVFSGTPATPGPSLGVSSIGFAPVVSGLWGVGNYFVQIQPGQIAANGEVVSGNFVTAAVPEPATWAFMLLGVGLAGAALRMTRRDDGFTPAAA